MVMMRNPRLLVILLLQALVHQGHGSLEVGVWDIETTKEENYIGVVKNVYKDTKVNIRVNCETKSSEKISISIGYVIRRTPCWEEYWNINQEDAFKNYYNNPGWSFYPNVSASSNYIKSPEFKTECNDMINIHPYLEPAPVEQPEPQALASSSSSFFSTQDVGSASAADVKTR